MEEARQIQHVRCCGSTSSTVAVPAVGRSNSVLRISQDLETFCQDFLGNWQYAILRAQIQYTGDIWDNFVLTAAFATKSVTWTSSPE